jgi:hypothetical protein
MDSGASVGFLSSALVIVTIDWQSQHPKETRKAWSFRNSHQPSAVSQLMAPS